jgi:DNA polymerase III delta prime subunit
VLFRSDKNFINDIFKVNNKIRSFPLIFICNNQHSKLISDLKKTCTVVTFYTPSSYEIKNFIKKVSINEKLNIKDNVISDIIQFAQSDVRRLVLILQDLKLTYNEAEISQVLFEDYKNNSLEKNMEIGLFDATKQLLTNYKNIKDNFKLYEIEKVLLPLMVYKNYQEHLLCNQKNISSIMSPLSEIADAISLGDNIETSIYTDQNWYLRNIYGFYSCILASFLVNKHSIMHDNLEIKFTSDLNKTSLKKINAKNIRNLQSIVQNKKLDDILMINQLTNYLIENNQLPELVDIIKKYDKDIDVKDIELFSKIDKTASFTGYTTDVKKKINNIFKAK